MLKIIKAQPTVHIGKNPMKTLQDGATEDYVRSHSNSHGSYYQHQTTRSSKAAKEMLGSYAGLLWPTATKYESVLGAPNAGNIWSS